MPFFSIVGNEAQYVEFNDDLSNLGVDNVQDAIDAVVDDSVLIDTDIVVTGFTQLAENPAVSLPPVLYGTGAPSSGTGSDGDYYFDSATGNSLYLKTSGTWNQISPFSIFFTGYWPTSPAPVGYTYAAYATAAANANADLTHVIVVYPPYDDPPITSQNHMRALFVINRASPVADQDIIVWDGSAEAWTTTSNDADAVNYDNTTSALAATNVQDAIDEVVQDLANGLAAQNEASEITYNNATSGLAATDVKAAIDEVVAEGVYPKSLLAGPQDHLEYRVSGQWYRAYLHSIANTSGGVVTSATNSAPTSSDGQVGDYWLHSAASPNAPILYGPKQADNSWPKIGKAVGSMLSPAEPEGYHSLTPYGPAATYKEPYDPALVLPSPTMNYAIEAGFVSAGANSRVYQYVVYVRATSSGWYPAVDPVRWNLEAVADVNPSNVQDKDILSWDTATLRWVNRTGASLGTVPAGDSTGQLPSWNNTTGAWTANTDTEGNSTGQLLSWDNTNAKWVANTDSEGDASGQLLAWDNTNKKWVANTDTDGDLTGQLLAWDNTNKKWAPQDDRLPEGNAEGEIIRWNDTISAWLSQPFLVDALLLNNKSADYTLVQSDAGKAVVLTGSNNRTFTVPTFATTPYATGTIIYLVTAGTGHITVAGASGVTVNGTTNLNSQGIIAILLNVAQDEWVVHH